MSSLLYFSAGGRFAWSLGLPLLAATAARAQAEEAHQSYNETYKDPLNFFRSAKLSDAHDVGADTGAGLGHRMGQGRGFARGQIT